MKTQLKTHARDSRDDAASIALLESLKRKIQGREAVVGVIGLGYVGLPFAVEQAEAGFPVVGVDLSEEKCALVQQGKSYIPMVSDARLKGLAGKKRLRANQDFSELSAADIIVISVPTPITRSLTPDLGAIEEATREVARYLRRGQLVCLQSTTFPGTTESVVRPILEASGLRVEEDFFLSYSPERMDPGNPDYRPSQIPRLVGGIGPRSLALTELFYGQTIEKVVPVSNTQAAEMAKVYENTFRAVNLALVNEFARLCFRMGQNTWEILDAAFTKPYGIMKFFPGPGVGGHCTPVDPHYLEWKAKELNFYTQFIDLAGRINRSMPDFVCDRAWKILARSGTLPAKAKVLVLGVAYKRDVPDCRNSPSIEIIRELRKETPGVSFHDPYVRRFDEDGLVMEGQPFLTEELLQGMDLVIIATDHKSFDYEWVVKHSKLVFDTRNATGKVSSHRDRIHLL